MSDLIARLQSTLGSGYRVTRELGGGGMSRVFAAQEVDLDRDVVVKVLPPDLGAGLNVERFRREIQLAAKLQHPHIVPLLSAGAKDGLLYYTMPHIDGDSLRNKLAHSGEMPVPETIRVLRDVADALEYAHEHGVAHRDIKPENVLMSGHHGLVTDFGVSKALASSTGQQSLTSMGVALGTPTYMSPEQATADPNVDHRTDIYALGILGYELLAGRPPFSGNTPQQVLAAQVTELPVDIKKHRPNIPSQLGVLIMRCLEKKPADRWQTAREVRLQLEALGTPSGGTIPYQAAVASGHTSGVSTAIRNRPLGSVAAVAAAVLVIAALAFAARALLGRSGAAPVAAGAAKQITNDVGIEITPALSPDGKLVAYAGGRAALARIYVRQLAGGDPVEVAASLPSNQRSPQWSSDGSQIVFSGVLGIYAVPALGGVPRLLVQAGHSPAWSHNGKSLAFAQGTSLFIADADGRNAKKILDNLDGPHSIAWSPDDARLAYVAGNAIFVTSRTQFANISPAGIWTVGRDGADPHEVVRPLHLNVSPIWIPSGRGLLFVSNALGGRDIYYQPLSRAGAADGAVQRLTTGLSIHGISSSADGTKLAYSAMTANVSIWVAPIPSATASVSTGHPVSQSNERIETPRVSPDGKWIAFDSDRSGTSHIYRIPVAGGTAEQLTNGAGDEFFPHWSPDETRISYHMWNNGNRDSYVTPVSGYAPRLVMGGPGHQYAASWSPDGSQLVVPSTGKQANFDLYIVPVAGGPPRRLTTTGTGAGTAWSPDGKGIAALFGHSIQMISPQTGAIRQIEPTSSDSLAFTGQVEWSSDSRELYFVAQDPQGKDLIGIMNADGSKQRVLLRFDRPEAPLYRANFSTDGHNFYFPVGRHEADIWVMDLLKK